VSAAAEAAAEVRVRPAVPDDVEQIHGFVIELAEYERAREQVTGTVEMLRQALFGPRPAAEALVATVDGETVGFALFHGTFSTWECAAGLARIAVERGCPRLEWHALDWNELALGFYARLGAERLSPWELHRLSGEALRRVAGQAA
jgi:hypothetical protein